MLIAFNTFANLDSLSSRLKRAKNDSARIELYYRFSLSDKYTAKVTDSLLDRMATYRTHKDCFIRFFSNYKIGQHFAEKEIHTRAIENILIALKVADSCKSTVGLMLARNKLAFVNKIAKNFKAAIYNSHLSLMYARQLKDSLTLWSNYTLLGNMYKSDMLLDSALLYHMKALDMCNPLNDKNQLSLTYNNLGLVFKNKNNYPKALEYLRGSLALKIEIKDKGVHSSYNNMAIVFKRMGKFDSAIFYSAKSISEGLKRKNGNALAQGVSMLAELYDTISDAKTSVYYYKRLKLIEDSLNKEKIDSDFQELQSKYESDKKDADLKLKGESLKTAEALNSRKNILIILSTIALLMALIAGVFIFRSYRLSKRNALQLGLKNKIIGEKNKEITDSINYAKNIQQGLITSEEVFKENLKDHFILYLPKDIVSGDFYWAQKVGEEFLIMCADCTGHGVPGAFMSLMGIGFLKEIVNQKELIRPDLVLNELRERIVSSFGVNANKDGMDASLVKINGSEMQVSAANNSIWIIRNNESMVVKPDKFPVGVYSGEKQDFTLNTIQLQKNDLVLMYTDGYGDQFGGPHNKKFKHKTMEKLLVENQDLSMEQMKKLLFDTLMEWKGGYEQLDDILVIGFRI